MLEDTLPLPSSGTHTENGFKSHNSSDELENAYCSTNLDEDFRCSERSTDLSGTHFKFPHSEQNPTVDALEAHALMVTCSTSNDKKRGVSQDTQNAAACLLQGCCRGKLWRLSWMLECEIHRKGFLMSWVLYHALLPLLPIFGNKIAASG
jgi:hypothetical protein